MAPPCTDMGTGKILLMPVPYLFASLVGFCINAITDSRSIFCAEKEKKSDFYHQCNSILFSLGPSLSSSMRDLYSICFNLVSY